MFFQEAGFTEVERNPDDGVMSIELSYCNNYYEDMILELLNTLLPFTVEGCISYRGEEGDFMVPCFLPAGNGLSGADASAMMNRYPSSKRPRKSGETD